MPDARTKYTCGGCTNTWTGLAQCHCSACHNTFGGISNFDRHRYNGECRRPEDIGLAIGARGVWSEPFSWQREGDTDERVADLLAAFAHAEERGVTRRPDPPPTDDEPLSLNDRFFAAHTHDDVAALSELGSDDYTIRRVPRDELLHWLQHGHIDTDGPEQ